MHYHSNNCFDWHTYVNTCLEYLTCLMMGTPQVNVSLVGKFDRKDEVCGTYTLSQGC